MSLLPNCYAYFLKYLFSESCISIYFFLSQLKLWNWSYNVWFQRIRDNVARFVGIFTKTSGNTMTRNFRNLLRPFGKNNERRGLESSVPMKSFKTLALVVHWREYYTYTRTLYCTHRRRIKQKKRQRSSLLLGGGGEEFIKLLAPL